MSLWENKNWGPMLLKETNKPFNDQKYIYEMKFDGIRAIIYANPKIVKIYNRYHKEITNLYPELLKIKNLVKENVIFDGEIVLMDNGLPSFLKLQERIHLKSKQKIDFYSKNNPVVFVAFDILYEDGDLINNTLTFRQKILHKYPDSEEFIKSKIFLDGLNLFDAIKKIKAEGIVAKKKNSKYLISTRSDDWLKIKNFKVGKFYIGGYIEKEDNYVISLVLGEKTTDEKLKYVGKVSIAKKKELYQKVKSNPKVSASPFIDFNKKEIIYIKPNLTCQVKYMEKTSNNHLRQPFIS